MKRTFLVMLALGLALILVACERPLQEEPEVPVEPTVPLLVTPLGAPELPDTLAPGGLTGEGNAPVEGETGGEQPGNAPGGEPTDPGAVAPAEGDAGAEAAPPEQPTTPEGNIIHTVVAGDTLFNLGRFYGVEVNDIAQANQLANPNALSIGDQLIIPIAGVESAEPTAERTHVVSAGDTLFRIGLTYGFTVAELAAYNNLANPDVLEVGQVIRIPPAP